MSKQELIDMMKLVGADQKYIDLVELAYAMGQRDGLDEADQIVNKEMQPVQPN